MGTSSQQRLRIQEAIVVEGRDDVEVVERAVDALVIPTHGFGITKKTWELIERAYNEKGLIILTDPDHSGEEIRRKLTERFPESKQAYVPRELAVALDDIGVENATPETVVKAIQSAKATTQNPTEEVSDDDIARLGLKGTDGAAALREKVAAKLGIGYGNAKAMRKMINGYAIGLAEVERAVEWAKEK